MILLTTLFSVKKYFYLILTLLQRQSIRLANQLSNGVMNLTVCAQLNMV